MYSCPLSFAIITCSAQFHVKLCNVCQTVVKIATLCLEFELLLSGLVINRSYLESESDKDMPAIMQLRLHFARFLYKMIASVPGESLFTLS